MVERNTSKAVMRGIVASRRVEGYITRTSTPVGEDGTCGRSFVPHDEALREHTHPVRVHSAPFLRDLVILEQRPALCHVKAPSASMPMCSELGSV